MNEREKCLKHLDNCLDILAINWYGQFKIGNTKYKKYTFEDRLKRSKEDINTIRHLFFKYHDYRMKEVKLFLRAARTESWKNFLEIGTGWGMIACVTAGEIAERKDKDNCFYQTVDYSHFYDLAKEELNLRQQTLRDMITKHSFKFWNHTDIGSNEFFKKNKKKFDFIYIDGDHSYGQTKKDWEGASKVISTNGIILMHDLHSHTQGLQYPRVALRAYEEIPADKWVKCILDTPHRMGMVHHRDASPEIHILMKSLIAEFGKVKDRGLSLVTNGVYIDPDLSEEENNEMLKKLKAADIRVEQSTCTSNSAFTYVERKNARMKKFRS